MLAPWTILNAAAATDPQHCPDAARTPLLPERFGTVDQDRRHFHELRRELRRTFLDQDYQKAKTLATEYLALATNYPCDATYGDAIFSANLYLGRIAFKAGDVDAASHFLLAAGQTPGSAALDSVGPDLTLANQLLDAGKANTVVEFLLEVRHFWKPGIKQTDVWIAEIKAGRKPYLNPLEGETPGILVTAFSFASFLFLIPAIPALAVFLAARRRLHRRWSFLVSAVLLSYALVFLVALTPLADKAAILTLVAPVIGVCGLFVGWRFYEEHRSSEKKARLREETR